MSEVIYKVRHFSSFQCGIIFTMIKAEKRAEKREKDKYSQKLYHASPTKYKPGDRINPFHNKKNFYHCGEVIYMTGQEAPHYTIWKEAFEGDWDVYEVKPSGRIHFGSCWDEYFTEEFVEVVKKVGSAKGLAIKGNLTPKDRRKIEEALEQAKASLKRAEEDLAEELAKENPDPEKVEQEKYWINGYKYTIKYPLVKMSKAHSRHMGTINCNGGSANFKNGGYTTYIDVPKNSKALK